RPPGSGGTRIPMESTPEPGDAEKLRGVLRQLELPEGTSETDALDRLYHLLDEGALQVSDRFNESVLFLLYRLTEGFGPPQAKDWIPGEAELTRPGAITPADLGKRARLADWQTEEWVTVRDILSGEEYEECYRDPSIECVGSGCFANNSEYFLGETQGGTKQVWACNDEWKRMNDVSS
ncbi:MAG TPA: hypothetical protein VM389_03960, partial [Phycisphaerae bacterium]|nr:hypothetical protein [Phycisphaerae bacterium]